MNRKDYLARLFEEIFGKRSVNYKLEDDKVCICDQSGLLDKGQCYSKKTAEGFSCRCRVLFESALAMSKEDVFFDIDVDDIPLSREIVVERAAAFLENEGVSFIDRGDREDNYLLCTLFCSYLIPAIFYIKIGDFDVLKGNPSSKYEKQKLLFEDIDDAIAKAVTEINIELGRRQMFKKYEVSADEIYNPKEKPEQCNYAVPLRYDDFFSLVMWNPLEFYVYRRSVIKNEEENPEVTSKIEKLTKGYLAYSCTIPLKKRSTILNNPVPSFNLSNEQSEIFTICSVDMPFTYEQEFYYLTRITDEILEHRYGNPDSHEELHEMIKKRAAKDVLEKNISLIEKYYESIVDCVEYFLGMLENMGMSNFVKADPTQHDLEECKRLLSWFSIDSEYIIGFLTESAPFDEKSFLQVYMGLDRTINNFIENIIKYDEFVEGYNEYLSKSRINSHKMKLQNFLDLPDFIEAKNAEQECMENHNDIIGFDTEFGKIYRDRNIFRKLDEVLKGFLEALDI